MTFEFIALGIEIKDSLFWGTYLSLPSGLLFPKQLSLHGNAILFRDSVNNFHFVTADLEEASLKKGTHPVPGNVVCYITLHTLEEVQNVYEFESSRRINDLSTYLISYICGIHIFLEL